MKDYNGTEPSNQFNDKKMRSYYQSQTENENDKNTVSLSEF